MKFVVLILRSLEIKILVYGMILTLSVSLFAHDLVDLQEINSRIRINILYATNINATEKVIYKQFKGKAYLLREVALQLSKVQDELELMGLGLLVWDAYRPLQAQKFCYDQCPEHLKQYFANPNMGGKHTRGTAVDCTIVDFKTGELVVMQSGFDELSQKAWHLYDDVSDEVRRNRALLRFVMEKHGFWGVAHEWWHYDYSIGLDGTTNFWQKCEVLNVDFDLLL